MFSKYIERKRDALTKLLSFVKINASDDKFQELLLSSKTKRNQTKERFFNSIDELNEDELNWINTISKEMKMKLGYEKS